MKAYTKKLFFMAGLILPCVSFAQGVEAAHTTSYFSNPLFNTLLLVIIVLAIMVLALSTALKNVIGSDLFLEKLKREKEQKETTSINTKAVTLLFLMMSLASFAQDKTPLEINDNRIGGLDQFTFYVMLITIALELLVIGVLFNTFKKILGVKKKEKLPEVEAKLKTKTILDKLNDTVDIEEEDSILLDHDYDGIKELDNNLPPWWKYGFYLTVLIAIIYMINYHITKTAPLQKEEYTNSLKKAEAEIAEFMKTSANNVDETTVKMLSDPADLAAGKDIFSSTCSACHGKLGEGGVGPNMTDDYWLHGGSVKDIFKTIKYGWPDKGMKSWKEDLSPMQIAQITSFIRTLKGTNPPKPKDKQGDLYMEANAPADSTTKKTGSTTALISELPK